MIGDIVRFQPTLRRTPGEHDHPARREGQFAAKPVSAPHMHAGRPERRARPDPPGPPRPQQHLRDTAANHERPSDRSPSRLDHRCDGVTGRPWTLTITRNRGGRPSPCLRSGSASCSADIEPDPNSQSGVKFRSEQQIDAAAQWVTIDQQPAAAPNGKPPARCSRPAPPHPPSTATTCPPGVPGPSAKSAKAAIRSASSSGKDTTRSAPVEKASSQGCRRALAHEQHARLRGNEALPAQPLRPQAPGAPAPPRSCGRQVGHPLRHASHSRRPQHLFKHHLATSDDQWPIPLP
jgi:hypothetical protein